MKNLLAPGFKRFEFRSGMGGVWGGMVTQGDPAKNPPFNPRFIGNGRLVDGEVRERAGLSKLNSSVMDAANACIKSMGSFDCGAGSAKKLWILGNGCPGISAVAGYYVATLDQEQDPEFQRAVYYSSATTNIVVGSYGGDIYIGTDSALRKLQIIRSPWGTENLSLSGSTQDTPIETFTGYTIRCLKEFDGKLFIGLDNGAGASKVATWDGISIRDDKTGIDAPTCMALYRIQNGGDALAVGTATSANIYLRPTGSTATYTSIGTAASVFMLSYKDVLFIADGGANVRSWDGTSLAISLSPAGATAVRALALFNGYLYAGYETAAAAIIAKYDGSSWTSVEKDLTAQFSGITSIRSLAAYRGFLLAAGTRSGAGRIYVSPGTTTSGTYTEITPNASNNGIVLEVMAA